MSFIMERWWRIVIIDENENGIEWFVIFSNNILINLNLVSISNEEQFLLTFYVDIDVKSACPQLRQWITFK